jgi:hypothetical protein
MQINTYTFMAVISYQEKQSLPRCSRGPSRHCLLLGLVAMEKVEAGTNSSAILTYRLTNHDTFTQALQSNTVA